MHATYTGEDDDVFYEADQSVPSTPSGGDDDSKSFSRTVVAEVARQIGAKTVPKKADQVVVQSVEKKVLGPAKAMVTLLFGIFLGMMLNESFSINLVKMLLG